MAEQISEEDRRLRVGMLVELKGGPAVISAADVVAALSSDDERTRRLAWVVAKQRGIQIVLDRA